MWFTFIPCLAEPWRYASDIYIGQMGIFLNPRFVKSPW
jgi:hypothetical protein